MMDMLGVSSPGFNVRPPQGSRWSVVSGDNQRRENPR